MKVVSLDGVESNMKFLHRAEGRQHCSDLHKEARGIISQIFKTDQVFEEVPVPRERLTLDFFIPTRKLAIEVHGEQHYKFVPHFHITKFGFLQSKKRDARKKEWCHINNIILVELKYDERDGWETAIRRGV